MYGISILLELPKAEEKLLTSEAHSSWDMFWILLVVASCIEGFEGLAQGSWRVPQAPIRAQFVHVCMHANTYVYACVHISIELFLVSFMSRTLLLKDSLACIP